VTARKGKRDSIFALIAAHNAKLAAMDKAKAALKRLEEKLDAQADHQAKAEKRLLSHGWPPLYLGHAYPIFTTGKAVKNHVHFRLRDAGTALGPKTQRKLMALQSFARKEIEAMYESFIADHRRKRDAAGLTALHNAHVAAARAVSKAQRRMVSTAPRTPQGAAALAAVLPDIDWPDPDMERGMQSLARAVAMCTKRQSGSRTKRSKA
jgi:hypothetical protein